MRSRVAVCIPRALLSSPTCSTGMPLPADPEERRVAMARRGLRGLPGHTRTTSSWHCKQMTWFSGFSPTLLQPMCSPPAWIFIPCLLIWRTSRMSAPASCSSILHFTGGGHTYYARLRRAKATTSPVPRASSTPPTALDSGAVCSNLLPAPAHLCSIMSASLGSCRCWCCSLYARVQAWLLHVVGEVAVSSSCEEC